MKKALSIIALIIISTFSYGQTNDIKIKFIGNCGLYMTDGNLNIYVDFPYKSGAYGYMKYDESEIANIKENPVFIFTHKHADHYSGKVLRKLDGKKYGPWNIRKLKKINDTVNEFSIQVFKTRHRFCLKHYSYLITWHNKRIFLSGDTENAETIGKVKDMDWAFVPTWVLSDAKEKGIKIDAKMKGIYHLYPNERIGGEIPDDFVIFKEQNKTITIPY